MLNFAQRICAIPAMDVSVTFILTTNLCVINIHLISSTGLRCYECEGTGQKDDCMVNPSKVAKVLMCQPKESCYVERKTVMTNSTSNSTGIEFKPRNDL